MLSQIALLAADGSNKANEVTAAILRRFGLNTGIFEYLTDSGIFKFMSDSSLFQQDSDGNTFLNNIAGLIGIFEYSTSFGSEML